MTKREVKEMGIGYWIVRTYEAGDVGEKTKFWIPEQRPTKSERRLRSNIKKQEQNEASTVKGLARIINANFTAGDVLLGLDYSKAGMKRLEIRARAFGADRYDKEAWPEAIRQAAEHEVRLVLRRVKRELGSVKYIAITSDMDGDTGEVVRVHHHLIVSGDCLDSFRKKWKEVGGVSWSHLGHQDDYMPIAEYLMRQVRHVPDAKKYISSRNLIRPQPKDRIVISGAELRVPRGGRILYRNEYRPGMPQYIRYVLPAAEQRRREAMERVKKGVPGDVQI